MTDSAYFVKSTSPRAFIRSFQHYADMLHRGSYMSAHVLLNLLNELGEKISCEALPSILSVFPNEFNKFSNTGAWMQDAIYNMTLKSHFISKFCIRISRFRH